jgi:hypothetical protein
VAHSTDDSSYIPVPTLHAGKSINLTAACRAEVIGHQRIFVNGLEQMFSNGGGWAVQVEYS